MSRTAKLHTKVLCVALVSLVTSTYALASDDEMNGVTPLQLRALQTRKFTKPIGEVGEAIKTDGEDRGRACTIYSGPQPLNAKVVLPKLAGQCTLKAKPAKTGGATAASFIPFIGGLVAAGMQSAAMDEMYAQVSSIKYDMTGTKPDETVVRMRIYNLKQEQITDPEIYSKEFKGIADAMFIQAIELTPAEQQ